MSEAPTLRLVVVGQHSEVWRRLAPRVRARPGPVVAISHQDLGSFRFLPSDRVWLMSYSHSSAGNAAMLDTLGRAEVTEIVYVSSSSTIVGERTNCYAYPRVKGEAERAALRLPNARVLTLGLMHETPDDLPAGPSVATSYDELAAFMLAPRWQAQRLEPERLFRRHDRPYASAIERALHRAYGVALRACGAFPCLLRPVDLALRAGGMRWYGYTYLSNALWTAKIS